MWTSIISLFTNTKVWLYAILAGGAVGGYLYINYLQSDIDNLNTQLSIIVSVHEENAKELEELTVNYNKNLELIAIEHKKELQRLEKVTSLKKEVENVKEQDDAIIAPVLINTINRLRQ